MSASVGVCTCLPTWVRNRTKAGDCSRRRKKKNLQPSLQGGVFVLFCFFGAALEAAESGEQPGSRHGQVGLLWQQPSLHRATLDGETAADDEGMSQETRRRCV